MTFNSAPFWAFCAIAVSGYYAVPHRARWAWLLGASYVFYGSFGLQVLGVLAGLTALVYGVSLVMDRASGRTRRLLLLVNVGVPLAGLVFFKYLALIWQAIAAAAQALTGSGAAPPVNVLAPIGISFYVFKLLSYAIDVYRRTLPAERHAGRLALYVAYFPQILAGPIERPGEFLSQSRRSVSWSTPAVAAGVRLIAWGLFKKLVVADRLAFYVGEVFLSPAYKSLHLVFAAYFYYIQIYCDFSGYSDISSGISRALGLSPPVNFNYPYLAVSVGDFWRRWHITLSTWLRDYLFLPIAYAVMRRVDTDRWCGVTVEVWGYTAGALTTFMLGGLWHGAAWTFLAWGALHGVYLVISHVTHRARRRAARAVGLSRMPRVHRAFQLAVTSALVSLAWIIFRSASFTEAWTYLRYLQFKLPSSGMANLVFNLAIVGAFLGMEWVQRNRSRILALDRVPLECKAVGYALFVAVAIAFSVSGSNSFIYFRF